MPLVSEVLNIQVTAGRAPAEERELWTDCPECGSQIHLDQATVDQTDPYETTYRCPTCEAVILIVSTPGVITWEGRGYRLGKWMIRNPRNLYYRPKGSRGAVHFPASPHALD